MSIIKIFIPLLYCLLVGTAYGALFKRRFIDSLAPVFFIQILIMLVTGMVVESLLAGIYVGIALAIVVIVLVCVKERSMSGLLGVMHENGKTVDLGICLFVFTYFCVFLSNVGKHYNMWDEFSHWGWFVRESFNDDFLYCISQKYFEHKEYVPGVSLFEVLWCRLSLKYSEPNAYRGIQMLQASMLLPVVTRISLDVSERFASKGRKIVMLVINLFIVFTIPLFSSLPFYHTLYEDLILGVYVFYCIWITVSECFSGYSVFLFGLALSNLLLCKMTGLAFVPILFLFYAIWNNMFSEKTVSGIGIWIKAFIAVIASIVPWRLYNVYLKAKGVHSASQNYGSVKFGSVIDVILHNGAVSYQGQVDQAYFGALAQKGIIGNLSYIWIVAGCTVILAMLMLVVDNKGDKKRIGLITLWVFLAGVYYAILMYFMYMLMFSEYEATGIASFTRYMSTYVLIALLIVAMTFIVYGSSKYYYISYLAAIMLAENVAIFFGAYQMLPGIFTNDEVWYEGHVDYLNNSLPDGASVLFICSLADMGAVGRIQFYCEDISLIGGIFGPAQYDADVWSIDLSVEEFVDKCTSYDFLYFFSYEDNFIELYQDAFEDQDAIALGKLYSVEKIGEKIKTNPVN